MKTKQPYGWTITGHDGIFFDKSMVDSAAKRNPGRVVIPLYADSADAEQIGTWQPITTIPPYQWVLAYSQDYADYRLKEPVCRPSENYGTRLILYRAPCDGLPGEVIDATGCLINWQFTHWMPLPEGPTP